MACSSSHGLNDSLGKVLEEQKLISIAPVNAEKEKPTIGADNPIDHSAGTVQPSQRFCLLAKPSQVFVENILKYATPDHGHKSTNIHFIT